MLKFIMHPLALLGKRYIKYVTKNGKKIPLFWATLDLDKYHEKPEGSAMCHFLRDFSDDEKLRKLAFDMIDHIRNNYDMDKLISLENSKKNIDE